MDNLSEHSAEMHTGDVAEAPKEHPELSHHNSDGNMTPSNVGNITEQTSIPLAGESVSDIQDDFLCYDEDGNPNVAFWSFIPPHTPAARIWDSCLDLFMAYMDTTGINWQALHLDKLFNFSRLLGTLEASSGYRVDKDTGSSLDWALFRLDDDNRSPMWNNFHLWDLVNYRKGWKRPGFFMVKAIADPVPGEEVVKCGRRTGRTFGVINGVKEGVNLQENGRSTKEWQIIDVDGDEFSNSGDSGSLILNKKFEAVGILTGLCSYSMVNGLDNKPYMCHCQTFFTPIRMILDDIKRLTGKDLILWSNI
ncbi:hypothetical protein H072_3876 [Dactylellina haptotyla CBS 200.50]|uniref:Peptidase S1 domain-containing protein n=1 Tax=Dactylellina haptotyla (strain CBS 200.50) TaxID=1284197 RepID=S8C3C2_DACHA|nr:hypothetical protein H072_3876 [Dactylellina haptotyla CBS 200.50]